MLFDAKIIKMIYTSSNIGISAGGSSLKYESSLIVELQNKRSKLRKERKQKLEKLNEVEKRR